MLNKLEREVMLLIYNKCVNKESALISPKQLIISLLPDHQVTEKELDKIVNDLSLDGYIDVINSNNKGSHIYCISLKLKGVGFKRQMQNLKKETKYLLYRKIILAVIGVGVTIILTAVINWLRNGG